MERNDKLVKDVNKFLKAGQIESAKVQIEIAKITVLTEISMELAFIANSLSSDDAEFMFDILNNRKEKD